MPREDVEDESEPEYHANREKKEKEEKEKKEKEHGKESTKDEDD